MVPCRNFFIIGRKHWQSWTYISYHVLRLFTFYLLECVLLAMNIPTVMTATISVLEPQDRRRTKLCKNVFQIFLPHLGMVSREYHKDSNSSYVFGTDRWFKLTGITTYTSAVFILLYKCDWLYGHSNKEKHYKSRCPTIPQEKAPSCGQLGVN